MRNCRHSMLNLIGDSRRRLRCRRCHLTIAEEELLNPWCPECHEAEGKEYRDFETVDTPGAGGVKYRCAECGIIIEC